MTENYLSITETNLYIKNLINADDFLGKIYIKGEISNFKLHTRGHLYFTLKDDNSRISAVMFANSTSKLLFTPQDGMNVLVRGRISVYEATGQYQIYVEDMLEDGVGNLYLEYEKLKKKLETEGLFDSSHKRVLPKYPTNIGIVTASTGAAVKDIISTIKRRYPICNTILFPSLVQGSDAKENIVKQITAAQDYDLDLLIVGRGGGSIEDLWAFNEECVARAIYNSKIPVISAVGHDVDYTIADFVADLRAPTPTGAAEMAVPSIDDVRTLLKQFKIRASKSILNNVETYKNRLDAIKNSYILKNPLALYEVKEQRLSNYIETLNNIMKKKLDNTGYEFKIILNKLHLLNPLNILEKGYSVVSKDKEIVKSSKDVKINDELTIKLHEGKLKTIVKEIL